MHILKIYGCMHLACLPTIELQTDHDDEYDVGGHVGDEDGGDDFDLHDHDHGVRKIELVEFLQQQQKNTGCKNGQKDTTSKYTNLIQYSFCTGNNRI